MVRQILIDPLSGSSLRVEVTGAGNVLGTATGFVVEYRDLHYLITNWHVVAGRNADTGELLSDTGALPDELRIIHHRRQALGTWIAKAERLFDDDGRIQWIEHPRGREIDVVAIPLKNAREDVSLYPLPLALADTDMIPQVAMPVSIIGFPFGLATGVGWPIWKTGHIATDPDLNFDVRPAFLIDATTRGGMSGSPVILRLTGGYRSSVGFIMGGTATKFLGVYSGRIHEDAEIGRVWRPRVVTEILEAAV